MHKLKNKLKEELHDMSSKVSDKKELDYMDVKVISKLASALYYICKLEKMEKEG